MIYTVNRFNGESPCTTCQDFLTKLFLKFNLLFSKKTIKSVGTSIKLQNPMMQLKKIVNHPHLVKWEVDIETGATFKTSHFTVVFRDSLINFAFC